MLAGSRCRAGGRRKRQNQLRIFGELRNGANVSTPRRQVSHQRQAPNETTGAMRADEFDASAAVADAAVEDMEKLARGAGMLGGKRGPPGGSGVRLDQPVMSAGRHPASDI